MTEAAPKTSESLRPPLVKQFSVFLENKVGALLDLTRTLGDANIHICGLSVVDTADSSVVRMVVDDPDHCRDVLHEAADPRQRVQPGGGRTAARARKNSTASSSILWLRKSTCSTPIR